MKRFIIYHDDPDGRCAAAIAGRHADQVELMPVYIPVIRGDGLPFVELRSAEFATDECWVLDFSWPQPVMETLLRMFYALTWIDHHETAIEELASIAPLMDGAQKTDMATCFMTWHHVNGGIHTPIPVRLIADRDTWQYQFGNDARYFHEIFQLYQTQPGEMIWDEWLKVTDIEILRPDLEKGKILYEAKMRNFHRQAQTYGREENDFGDGHKVLTCNLRGDGDLGDVIQRMGYAVAHCYIDEPTAKGLIRRHSLYSKTVDVGAWAFERGGGGHKHAAGWVEHLHEETRAA